ncbi:unnamed protein product [Bursaphelenchus okinawaensis]|uniref:Uncharacterized protein n=1 Tax=Bursaphelenchus okinawaensis TaxID=465554 RepID=A0A811KCA3_9BILA|nr:unnamed protein product [Bursaphelenchus okinawaensis]CAG9099233.1 unnamed protein product [Bursaphelenchus okinawaensis]
MTSDDSTEASVNSTVASVNSTVASVKSTVRKHKNPIEDKQDSLMELIRSAEFTSAFYPEGIRPNDFGFVHFMVKKSLVKVFEVKSVKLNNTVIYNRHKLNKHFKNTSRVLWSSEMEEDLYVIGDMEDGSTVVVANGKVSPHPLANVLKRHFVLLKGNLHIIDQYGTALPYDNLDAGFISNNITNWNFNFTSRPDKETVYAVNDDCYYANRAAAKWVYYKCPTMKLVFMPNKDGSATDYYSLEHLVSVSKDNHSFDQRMLQNTYIKVISSRQVEETEISDHPIINIVYVFMATLLLCIAIACYFAYRCIAPRIRKLVQERTLYAISHQEAIVNFLAELTSHASAASFLRAISYNGVDLAPTERNFPPLMYNEKGIPLANWPGITHHKNHGGTTFQYPGLEVPIYFADCVCEGAINMRTYVTLIRFNGVSLVHCLCNKPRCMSYEEIDAQYSVQVNPVTIGSRGSCWYSCEIEESGRVVDTFFSAGRLRELNDFMFLQSDNEAITFGLRKEPIVTMFHIGNLTEALVLAAINVGCQLLLSTSNELPNIQKIVGLLHEHLGGPPLRIKHMKFITLHVAFFAVSRIEDTEQRAQWKSKLEYIVELIERKK